MNCNNEPLPLWVELDRLKMSHKQFERSVKVTEFQEDLEYLLVEEDRQYVQHVLKEFSTYKDVPVLVKSLLSVLKTPETRDMLLVVRELLPKKNHKEFDRLAPYHKMAHPYKRIKYSKEAAKHLHTVWLERKGRQPLGFSIRGGKEMGLGIYVSEVDLQSLSDRAGLSVGDQIVEVNGINFEWLSHSSAVRVFKAYNELEMLTYNSGRLPKFEEMGEAFRWIDPLGNPVEGNELEDAQENFGEQPFSSSSDKKKVVIKKKPGRSVGLRIRGGKEFKLGIFVVSVDKDSLAEDQGLLVGDQILMVNGISFRNILHEEAVSVLKTNDVLMMSVQCVGRIPRLKSQYRKKGVRKDNSKDETTDQSETQAPVRHSFKDGLTESPKFSSKSGKTQTVSPLSTLDKRRPSGMPMKTGDNSSSDDISIDDDENQGSSKFQYTIGKGIMLSSTAHNPVREQIKDTASKLLNDEDQVTTLERKFAVYEEEDDVQQLIDFLVIILDTAEKLKVLEDIRCGLKPQDLTTFDKTMSTHELKIKKKLKKKQEKEEDGEDVPEPSPVVLRPKKKQTKQSESEEDSPEPVPVSIKPANEVKKGKSRRSSSAIEEDDLPVTTKKGKDKRRSSAIEEDEPPIKETKKGKSRRSSSAIEEVDLPAKETKKGKGRRSSSAIEEDDLPAKETKKGKGRRSSSAIEEDEPPTKETKKGNGRRSSSAVEEDDLPVTTKKGKDKRRSSSAIEEDSTDKKQRPQSKQPAPPRSSKRDFEAIRQKIILKASQPIKDMAELKSIDRRLKEYGTNKDIKFLVEFLLTMLDNPKKRLLLLDIRELISEDHLVGYDEKVKQFLSGKPQKSASAPPTGSAPKPSTATPMTVQVETETPPTPQDEKPPKDFEVIRQKILTQASKVLKIKDELKGLERRLKQYEGGGEIDFLVTFLLTIFDSPKKHVVLADIREIINDKDLVKYDELTAKYLKKPEQAPPSAPPTATPTIKLPGESSKEEPAKQKEVPKPINIPPPPKLSPAADNKPPGPDPVAIAAEIKSKGGASGLKKVETKKAEPGNGEEEGGVFTDPAAQEVLQKAKSITRSSTPQTRESFLAWNDEFSQSAIGKPKIIISPGKPLHLEIQKTAFFLGIELKEGENGNLLIDEVMEDGAAFNDGFLTPGFKVLKVDNDELSGLTVGDAEAILNDKYESDKASINLLVVPPKTA